MSSVSIILPCLNEVTNISRMISSIRLAGWNNKDCEIIIVDDGSTDGTRELLERVGKDDPSLVIHFPERRIGLAQSIYKGLTLASSDYVAVMDSDGMHDPAYLAKMFRFASDGQTLVIGSRYADGGSSHGALYPLFSRIVNIGIRFLMKSKVKDQLCGFFVADRLALLCIPEQQFKGFGEYFISIIHFFEQSKFTILEVGTIHRVRDSGVRKSKRAQMLITYFKYAWKLRN